MLSERAERRRLLWLALWVAVIGLLATAQSGDWTVSIPFMVAVPAIAAVGGWRSVGRTVKE